MTHTETVGLSEFSNDEARIESFRNDKDYLLPKSVLRGNRSDCIVGKYSV